MSEHIKNPWFQGGTPIQSKDDIAEIFRQSLDAHVGPLGQYFMEVFLEDGKRVAFLAGPSAQENARRIVACVNACEGLPTELMEEANGKGETLTAYLSKMAELTQELELSSRAAHIRHSVLGVQNQSLRAALDNLLEHIELPPEANCRCFVAPPCNDCVEWSGLREAIEQVEKALKEVEQCTSKSPT